MYRSGNYTEYGIEFKQFSATPPGKGADDKEMREREAAEFVGRGIRADASSMGRVASIGRVALSVSGGAYWVQVGGSRLATTCLSFV